MGRPPWRRPTCGAVVHQECQRNAALQYIGEYKGRVAEVTYDIINDAIVVTRVRVMTAGTWEAQTGDALERIGQWIIEEHGDDMMMPAI